MLATMFRRLISWISSLLAGWWSGFQRLLGKKGQSGTDSPKKDGAKPETLPDDLPVDPGKKD